MKEYFFGCAEILYRKGFPAIGRKNDFKINRIEKRSPEFLPEFHIREIPDPTTTQKQVVLPTCSGR